MSPAQVVLLVAGILAAVGGIQAAVWIPIVRRLRRLPAALSRELAAQGETVVAGPERASYRGATAEYGAAGSIGVAALTDRRLVFRKVLGKPVDIAVADIAGVRIDAVFMGARRAGSRVVIVQLRNGIEVGFVFADTEAWAKRIAARPGA